MQFKFPEWWSESGELRVAAMMNFVDRFVILGDLTLVFSYKRRGCSF